MNCGTCRRNKILTLADYTEYTEYTEYTLIYCLFLCPFLDVLWNWAFHKTHYTVFCIKILVFSYRKNFIRATQVTKPFARKVYEPFYLSRRWSQLVNVYDWPPRSCDLTYCDFFFRDHVKEKVTPTTYRRFKNSKMHS